MNTLETLLILIGGIVLRFGIPVIITLAAIYLLRELDAHWQAEAQHKPVYAPTELPHCWETKGCSPEKRATCEGYLHATEQPCWQTYRTENGYLKEACLDCEVFHHAPIPQPKPIH